MSRKYYVQGGIEGLLDDIDADDLFGEIEGNTDDVVDNPLETKDYTITVDFKKGPQRVIQGTYDKKALPEFWGDFADSVWQFMRFYGMGEILDPAVYEKVKRRRTDYIYCSVEFDEGYKSYYFVQNPDMVLGEMVMESTRFGMDSVCRGDENSDLSELLQGAIHNLHAQITKYQHEELEEEDNSIPADPNVRNFSYTIVDGKIYFRENSRMNPVEVSVTAENRIRGMIALRDCVRRLIDYQTEGYPDEDIQREQRNLNTLYDDYTKKYGLLSSRGNSLAFGEDSSYFLLCSLEVLDEEGNFKRKADMFTKRTIRPHVAVTSVDTASEALAVSIAEKARVDMPFMAELSGKTEEELETELAGIIFRDVNCAERKEEIPVAFVDLERYHFVTADEYLSGNVRRKLRMVKALCEVLPEEKAALLQQNITALEAVQPVDLTAGEIGVRIGVNWVPREIYEQFLYEVIGTSAYARDKIHVLYSPHSGEWNVTNKSFDGSNIKAVTTYGTKRIISVASYIRHLINDLVPQDAPPPDYYAMMQQLYRIGNNLNQIAQKAHTLNVIDVQRYDAAMSQFEAAVKKIAEAVLQPRPMNQ